MTEKKIRSIVEFAGKEFRTFGGGKVIIGNPLSHALQSKPAQFAAGVSVEDVVRFVLVHAGEVREEVPLEKGVGLDELQVTAEKLLALLKDRQPGHFTWHGFMRERLLEMKKLIDAALGK